MESTNHHNIKWCTDILPKKTLHALNILAKESWLQTNDWYLAGGTALALHAGHRRSDDLDFFTQKSPFALQSVLKPLEKHDWHANFATENTVYGRISNAKISFIAYHFFHPRETMAMYGTVPVLMPKDIAVMKVIAISQRGKKRDFIDLYWYLQHSEPLITVMRRLPNQYPTVAHDFHHICKSLVYFEDAEDDPMPQLFFSADWKTIRAWFEREVPKLTKELLGLK
jgi:hypothetical protein